MNASIHVSSGKTQEGQEDVGAIHGGRRVLGTIESILSSRY